MYILGIILLLVDPILIRKLRRKVGKISSDLIEEYDEKIIEFVFYSIITGIYSMNLALRFLEEMARTSSAARKLIKYVNTMILTGGEHEVGAYETYRIRYVKDVLFSSLQVENPQYLSEYVTRDCEQILSKIQIITSRVEESLSMILFFLFFVPIVSIQVVIIVGNPYLIVGVPLLQVLFTLSLHVYVDKLSEITQS